MSLSVTEAENVLQTQKELGVESEAHLREAVEAVRKELSGGPNKSVWPVLSRYLQEREGRKRLMAIFGHHVGFRLHKIFLSETESNLLAVADARSFERAVTGLRRSWRRRVKLAIALINGVPERPGQKREASREEDGCARAIASLCDGVLKGDHPRAEETREAGQDSSPKNAPSKRLKIWEGDDVHAALEAEVAKLRAEVKRANDLHAQERLKAKDQVYGRLDAEIASLRSEMTQAGHAHAQEIAQLKELLERNAYEHKRVTDRLSNELEKMKGHVRGVEAMCAYSAGVLLRCPLHTLLGLQDAGDLSAAECAVRRIGKFLHPDRTAKEPRDTLAWRKSMRGLVYASLSDTRDDLTGRNNAIALENAKRESIVIDHDDLSDLEEP